MDLPIRIMITLFVALVVGSTIIVFSQQMISKSRDDIDKNRPGVDLIEDEEEKIIELNDVDTFQIVDLMTECYNRHHSQTFEREICFVVIGKSGSWVWDNGATGVKNIFEADTSIKANATMSSYVTPGEYAFSIYFEPYGVTETIEITR